LAVGAANNTPRSGVIKIYFYISVFAISTLSLKNVNHGENYWHGESGKATCARMGLKLLVGAHVALLRLSGTQLEIEVFKFL
jgi:hypothetical protein